MIIKEIVEDPKLNWLSRLRQGNAYYGGAHNCYLGTCSVKPNGLVTELQESASNSAILAESAESIITNVGLSVVLSVRW
jgi:hypothetical protein